MTATAHPVVPGSARAGSALQLGPSLPSATATVVPGTVVFGDDVWDLSPLCPRPTTRWIRLRFEHCPPSLREDIKHFFSPLLTVDTPLEQLERPPSARRRLSPSTLQTLYEDLKPFLARLHDRRTESLVELTDADLSEYAIDVANAPVGQNPETRSLFALPRLWLMAPYLRPSGQLRQPFCERDGMEQVVGKSEWTAENKSTPIHPLTMSALLVWCLRIVADDPQLAPLLRIPTNEQQPRPAVVDHRATPTTTRWCGEIDPAPDQLRRVLTTACLLTIAYLTGMRADEVLSLRRGCCTTMTNRGEGIGGYEIRGRTYKCLHDADLLFSATLFKARPGSPKLDPGAPSSNQLRESIERLTLWYNQRSHHLGRPGDVIPADPDGNINLRRPRRTLAWFIYPPPRGRVALGIQYGHLHASTTDGYGGRVSAGLRDLFPMEEAFAISDSLQAAAEHLDTNPTLSGPAAHRYRTAATECRDRYEGLTLSVKQAAALMDNPTMRVYDAAGQTLACSFGARKALCRKQTSAATAAAAAPDLTACDDKCANIARTDQHIDAIQADIQALRAELDARLTPIPLRHRLVDQIAHREGIVAGHAASGAHT